ncbi:helix-turn-helix domain-containing protein [Hymenobacter elongatus]|uniref:Helix-turn-helix domain-containing protein n=1 Tax=Hymenobacter elongatus TaxID=877208 RepID=A0A4Z0PMZ5_9BACT|nr:helix-turn-helix domain-containing protein [Hymenobacter elongatus]TGE17389.1 helix-turn-helix domain-containing protein [Hymenobacter elongatus]
MRWYRPIATTRKLNDNLPYECCGQPPDLKEIGRGSLGRWLPFRGSCSGRPLAPLPALVGTAPKSLIRTLGEFKADGLLELTPKNVRVLEPEKLRRARW